MRVVDELRRIAGDLPEDEVYPNMDKAFLMNLADKLEQFGVEYLNAFYEEDHYHASLNLGYALDL